MLSFDATKSCIVICIKTVLFRIVRLMSYNWLLIYPNGH